MSAKGLIGKKIGMTQVFDDRGSLVPVTVIEAGPCKVIQLRTAERDGYTALQLGFEPVKESRVNRPLRGHFRKSGVRPVRILREFRLQDPSEIEGLEEGGELRADVFQANEYVDITGISRGKGFQGAIKRHGFRRGPTSHGSKYHRRVGSQSAAAYPSRVFKGRKMPGRMGGRRVTVRGLRLVRVDPERNLLLVQGAVPGPRNGYVFIRATNVGRKRA